jgi:acetyl esterase/lipase
LGLPLPYGAIDLAARVVPKSQTVRRTAVQLPQATAQWVQARNASRSRVILYLHGGAFLVCGVNTHAGLLTRLSKLSNTPVLAVDYRMLPKHSIGQAIEDCVAGYDWLREQGYRADQIVIAGDSAGGYLTLAAAIHLRARGEFPAGLVMLSPLLQLDPAGKRGHRNSKSDAMFTAAAFDALVSVVKRANGGALWEPLDHLTWGLPPTLIHVSGDEVLLHDAEVAADCLSGWGNSVELCVWPGQVHVFQIAASFVPEGHRSLEQIARFIVVNTSDFGKCNDFGLTNRTGAVG